MGGAGPDVEGGHDEGGDEACWMERVCPECGGLAAEPPPTRCPRCDTAIEVV